MQYFPPALERLVEQFARLPGVGHKSAQRLAFYVLGLPDEDAEAFAGAITDAKRSISFCPVCQNFAEGEGPCAICGSSPAWWTCLPLSSMWTTPSRTPPTTPAP